MENKLLIAGAVCFAVLIIRSHAPIERNVWLNPYLKKRRKKNRWATDVSKVNGPSRISMNFEILPTIAKNEPIYRFTFHDLRPSPNHSKIKRLVLMSLMSSDVCQHFVASNYDYYSD